LPEGREAAVSLAYEELLDAVGGAAVGLRARTELQPLGGPGDKIFPPTYRGERAETVYAMETRRVDGETVAAVVLDSVASQANRFELALLEATRRGEISVPLVSVDFRGTEVADFDRLSALETHRTGSSTRCCATACSRTARCSGTARPGSRSPRRACSGRRRGR
jgi:hypothetical protein